MSNPCCILQHFVSFSVVFGKTKSLNIYISDFEAERMGFEPMRPWRQTVFKTAPLWPLRYLSIFCFVACQPCDSLIIAFTHGFVNNYFDFFIYFFTNSFNPLFYWALRDLFYCNYTIYTYFFIYQSINKLITINEQI